MKRWLEPAYFVLVYGEVSTAIPRILGGGERADTAAGHASNPLLLVCNLLIAAGTLVYAYPLLRSIARDLSRLKWLTLLYLWMLLSIAWSVDRPTSARIWLFAAAYLLSAAWCALRYSTPQLLARLGWCSLGSAIASVAGEFLLPENPDPAPGWTGIFLQKNTLGLMMMLGIGVLLAEGRRWSVSRIAIVALYLTLLGLSQSFTAIVGTAVLLLFVAAKRMGGRGRAMLWIWLGAALATLLLVSDPLALLLGAGGKTSGFTGRDVIWAYAGMGILEQPWIGHGCGGAFWASAADAEQALHWNPHHAHNGFLQVWLDLGIVGLVLTLGLLANTWRRARRLEQAAAPGSGKMLDTGGWVQLLLVTALAHNLMESDFTSNNLLWYLLLTGSFACLRVQEEASEAVTKPAFGLPIEDSERKCSWV